MPSQGSGGGDPKVYAVAPTFREPKAVGRLLACFEVVSYPEYELLLVNAAPGDETSALVLSQQQRVRARELQGRPDLFWSGSQNIALGVVLAEARDTDLLLLLNVDVTFQSDVISQLVGIYRTRPRTQLGAVACTAGIVMSSGVKVRSWALAQNTHPLAGRKASAIPAGYCEPMDFLPTRCVLFPVEAVRKAGLINERRLPHYGADYEFTNRLRRHGYQPFLCGDVKVDNDVSNTGYDLYHRDLTLAQRLRRLTSIKSPYNPKYRTNYALLTFPWYCVPSAILVYWLKTMVEVLCGGRVLRKVFSGTDRGFSG